MFENSTFFGVMEDGTINKFLMEKSIKKLRNHFTALYQRYSGYENAEYIYGYKNDHEELSCIDFDMDENIRNSVVDASTIEPLSINDDEWLNLRFVFMGEQIKSGKSTVTRIVFQRIQKNQIIGKRNGIHIFPSKETLSVFNENLLSISFRLECYFENGKLFFNSIWHARQVFDMSQFVKEATDDDVNEFASCNLFTDCDADEFLVIADQQMRSRITAIQASGALTRYSAKKIQSVAKKIGFEIKTKRIDGEGKIVLPESKKEIKTFLKILDETIYEGMLSGELKESNSSKPFVN